MAFTSTPFLLLITSIRLSPKIAVFSMLVVLDIKALFTYGVPDDKHCCISLIYFSSFIESKLIPEKTVPLYRGIFSSAAL